MKDCLVYYQIARYAEQLGNVVPMVKKKGKLRVFIDFRDLNKATPKYEYLMLIVDMLVDATTKCKVLFFIDKHFGYNQIYIAEEDVCIYYKKIDF